jgi:ATP-binding cassette subfamily F protein 3
VLLQLERVGRSFAARRLFGEVTLDVRPGDRIALVGPNGAGKTTLLRIAAGLDAPDEGRVKRSRTARVGLLRQEIDPTSERTVRAEAGLALAHLDALESELRSLETEMAGAGGAIPDALATRYDAARSAFELGGGFERAARVDRVLAGLGFDEADRDRPLSSFSGGWLMRVELAKLLLAQPDVLLLDEPTNHLDLPSIEWFEATLEAFRGAVIAISHDRAFLRRYSRRVAALERGRLDVYEGGWDRYLRDRAERREQLLAAKRNQDRKRAETERFIERFRYKASKARQVQSRVKALDKLERVEVEPDTRRAMRLRIPAPERAGDVVLTLEDVHKRYDDTVVYSGADVQIRRGDRVALVGPNGAGKSTLLRIAAGALAFESGERRLGHNVRAAFYAQHQLEVLDARHSVLQELEVVAKLDDVPRLRGHLGAFLFSGDDVEKKVSVLSGGEKARLALARMLLRPANFLIFDEPTNHLDLEACEVLEDALRAYRGTLLFISHDRSFIDALATRVVEVRAGLLREFPGNYSDYLGHSRTPDARPRGVPGHGRPHPTVAAPASDSAAESAAAPVEARAERREARREERERRKARERTQRRIERLEAEILERETALEELGWKLGDPQVHRDPERIRTLSAERAEVQEAIDAGYREWERLAAELESLEQADRSTQATDQ